MDASPILVAGAGAWGTALAVHLANNGNTVHLWGHDASHMQTLQQERCNKKYLPDAKFPESLIVFDDLPSASAGVTDYLIVIPSFAFVSFLEQLKSLNLTNIRVSWGTKGLDPSTKGLLHESVQRILGTNTAAAIISGPSFAKEVGLQMPTAVCIAGNDEAFTEDLMTRLHSTYFRVYKNNDFIGVQLCGVMKNILAIASGLAVGLGLGANARAALLTRGIAEMSKLLRACGGSESTLMGLAGMGDLVLTCTDDQSRNRRFGTALGCGTPINEAKDLVGGEVEGLQNTNQLYELGMLHDVEMPITQQVYKVLYEELNPRDALMLLLQRSRAETE